MSLKNPEYLWIGLSLLLVSLLAKLAKRYLQHKGLYTYKEKGHCLRFSYLKSFAGLKASFKTQAYRLLPILRTIGFVLLLIALARPQQGDAASKVTSRGISIMMVLDTSGSMKALDFSNRQEKKNRLAIIKEVFRDFVKKRDNDLIGLVSFGGYTASKCPLTLDHNALLSILDKIEIPPYRYDSQGRLLNAQDFQTAIGDAIAVAAERLHHQPGKSKVMILLTDGENNAGIFEPLKATEMAVQYNIKVYTVGVGSNDVVEVPVQTPQGTVYRKARFQIDEKLLKKIAQKTEGEYFHATAKEKLAAIYQKIDQLEKQEIKVSYLSYQERYQWFVIAGVFLFLLEKVLASTILRKVP